MKSVALMVLLLTGPWACSCALAQGAPLTTVTIHETEGQAPLLCDTNASQPQYFSWTNSTGHNVGITWIQLAAYPPDNGIVYDRFFIEDISQPENTGEIIAKGSSSYSDNGTIPLPPISFEPDYKLVLANQTLTLRLACLGPVGTTGGGGVRFEHKEVQ